MDELTVNRSVDLYSCWRFKFSIPYPAYYHSTNMISLFCKNQIFKMRTTIIFKVLLDLKGMLELSWRDNYLLAGFVVAKLAHASIWLSHFPLGCPEVKVCTRLKKKLNLFVRFR